MFFTYNFNCTHYAQRTHTRTLTRTLTCICITCRLEAVLAGEQSRSATAARFVDLPLTQHLKKHYNLTVSFHNDVISWIKPTEWITFHWHDGVFLEGFCAARHERGHRYVSACIMDDTQEQSVEIHNALPVLRYQGTRSVPERTENVKSMSQKSNKRNATYFIFLDCFTCVKSLILPSPNSQ